jgi:Flp pilus assembly protein TadG
MTICDRGYVARRHESRRAAGGRDAGSFAVEFALGVPIFVMVLFLLAAGWRVGGASIDVDSVAGTAARAASLARTPATAVTAARQIAEADLAGTCTRIDVQVDTANFHRGGSVTVQVTCTVSTRQLLGVHAPGSITTQASATSPLDIYRTTG